MVLREGRNAVITLIDCSAAFDTESQIFLDGTLADAGATAKVRCIIQAVFAATTDIVRVTVAYPGGFYGCPETPPSHDFCLNQGVTPLLIPTFTSH